MATVLTPGPLDDITVETATRAARGGTTAVRIGKAGEDAVRAVADIGEKKRFFINGRWRIADGWNKPAKTLSEVKNVNYLADTRQLRDYAAQAGHERLTFQIWVKPTTKISGPLQKKIDASLITRKYIP
jgi:hypothetical protein